MGEVGQVPVNHESDTMGISIVNVSAEIVPDTLGYTLSIFSGGEAVMPWKERSVMDERLQFVSRQNLVYDVLARHR